MTSLWQLTAPSLPASAFEKGGRFDTVVVGAGLTGVVVALLLARAGQRVTILEARSAGAVTTGNTTGKLSLLQGTVFSEIRRRAGDAVLQAYAEANREGQAWLLRELDTRGVDVERRVAYSYAIGAQGAELLDAEFDAARTAGVPVEKTGATGLPFETSGALRLASQVQLHPLVVLAELVAELREHGGTLVERCRVHDIESDEHGVRIRSELGDVSAETCVLATGTPILDRGMFFARLEPSRSFVGAYREPPAGAPTGMYVSVDGAGHSIRTATDAAGHPVLLLGGGAHVTGRGGDTHARLRELDGWAAEKFDAGQHLLWWAAQDYRSHSGVPFTGRVPATRGRVFTATGYNKWGMANAVAAALTLTAEIHGRLPEWARTLREHRLSLPEAQTAVRANVAVAGKLLEGWLGSETSARVGLVEPAEGEGAMARDGVSPIGVSRVDGRLCRVSGVCTHLGGVLSWNAAERSWDCPLHGSRFSADGRVLEGPAVADLEQR